MYTIRNKHNFTHNRCQFKSILFVLTISLFLNISNCVQQQINQSIINERQQSEGIRDTEINTRLVGEKIIQQKQQADKNEIDQKQINNQSQTELQVQNIDKQNDQQLNKNLQNNSQNQIINKQEANHIQQSNTSLKHKLKYIFRTLFKLNFTIPILINSGQQKYKQTINIQEQQTIGKENNQQQEKQIITNQQQHLFLNQDIKEKKQQILKNEQLQEEGKKQQIDISYSQKQQNLHKINSQKHNESNNLEQNNGAKINKTKKQQSNFSNNIPPINVMNTTHFLNIIFNKTLKQQSTTYNVNKIIKNQYNSLLSKLVIFISTFFVNMTPSAISETIQQLFCKFIDFSIRTAVPIIRSYYQLYKVLQQTPKYKSKKVYYENNYANLYGGAKIIMKSSPKIKSINAILEDGTDKYMYTDQVMPLKIIIGLNQEIAIDSILIQSFQMYSCITKQFKVEGKFTMEDKKWVHLGTFKAENIFGDQQFYTERKIIRYIKLTIFSSYGKWSYFTLTQVKIRGKNLFADALTDKKSQNKQKNLEDNENVESQSHKDEQERPINVCPKDTFEPPSQQPHQSNLIASLITKIDKLQSKNTGQSKQLEAMSSKFTQLSYLLANKTQQNLFYKQLLNEYKNQSNMNFYVIMFSVGLSFVTLCSLVCLCLIRRRQLAELKKNVKGALKKSSSFD